MREYNYVEFDATEDGMKLMAVFLATLRVNRQDFVSTFTQCGQSIRVTLI